VDVVLRPLQPLAVWLVATVMPPLRTLVSNMPPTHLDADKVLYGFLVPIYLGMIIGLFRCLRWMVGGRHADREGPPVGVRAIAGRACVQLCMSHLQIALWRGPTLSFSRDLDEPFLAVRLRPAR